MPARSAFMNQYQPQRTQISHGGPHTFSFGDKVVHAAKPEWGTGTVNKAQNLIRDGKACQSLTVRFERAGLKTVNTAIADIQPAADEPRAPHPAADPGEGWLAEAAAESPERRMAQLPVPCTDPFSTPASRLRATVDQYRFTPEGGSILDWAAVQTGLSDPLTRFSRHELEQFFRRYADNRDAHLRATAAECRKDDPNAYQSIVAAAPRAARNALNTQNARR